MDPATARNIAHYSHVGQRDRFGEPFIEHVERIAGAVPEDARSVAFLHDVVEHSATTFDDLICEGLTPVEFAALELLTRSDTETYELHTLRIAHARGEPGRLARVVKRADLEDHLSHGGIAPDAPPYAWARRHIASVQERAA